MAKQLSEYGEDLQSSFIDEYGGGNCACHIRAPCGSCTHPGNPFNLEETPEAWEEEVELKEHDILDMERGFHPLARDRKPRFKPFERKGTAEHVCEGCMARENDSLCELMPSCDGEKASFGRNTIFVLIPTLPDNQQKRI